MRVAAIVVAWNAAEQLAACLASLEAQDHPDLEVVVVDNASEDATADELRAAARTSRRHPLRVVPNTTNRGFCGGVNDGLAVLAETVDAVLLVNPDARAEPGLVSRCVAALASSPDIGSVQPRLRRPSVVGSTAVIDTTGHVLTAARLVDNRGEGEPDDGRLRTAGDVFGASGALVLHRRAMLDDVAWRSGPERGQVLTEELFAYFDDVELDWRARLLGWRAWYEPRAVGVHERGGAGPRRTARVEALNHTNRLLVIATCDEPRALARHAPLVVATSLLKSLELALTVPAALPAAIGRLRLLRGALRRRRELLARARVPVASVPARWVTPFSWKRWLTTWWGRTRPRQTGTRTR